MKQISGGVCAATGFSASGVHCGIRKNKTKRDLALIYSSVPASAAAVYTTNLVKGAPLVVTKQHLADGKAQAIICNSGLSYARFSARKTAAASALPPPRPASSGMRLLIKISSPSGVLPVRA